MGVCGLWLIAMMEKIKKSHKSYLFLGKGLVELQ